MRRWVILLGGVLALAAGSMLTGCEVGSPNEVVAGSADNFSGLYLNPDGGHLVTHNSGSPVDSLNVQQDGNQLQAVDNNSQVFSGTLGDVSAQSAASFNLTGHTTAGAAVTMSGTLQKNGTTATMSGIWAEPSLYGSINGRATVSASPTNQPPTTNTNTTVSVQLQLGRPAPWRLWFERDHRPAGRELALAPLPGSRQPC